MNRFTRLVKENLLPFIVFSVIAVSCAGAWYYLHPSSPYHDRYKFVVSYDAIGTLSPGNRVEVRGISCGQIAKVELTEDAVYVTVEVLASTRIPVNSEFRLINSGLMGEREMCILSGDSDKLIAPGDTLIGHYDEGMSGVGKKLAMILDDVSEIRDTLKAFVDSITVGEAGKSVQRTVKKAGRIVDLTKSDVQAWKEQVSGILDQLDGSLSQTKTILREISADGRKKLDTVSSLIDRTNELLERVKSLKQYGDEVFEKLDRTDNNIGLFLGSTSEYAKEVDKLIFDIDQFKNDIKKNGVKLNIDIF